MAEESAKVPKHILLNLWFIKNNSPKTIQAIKENVPALWAKIMKELRDFEAKNR